MTTTTKTRKTMLTATKAEANAIAAIAPDYDTAVAKAKEAMANVAQLDNLIESQMETRRIGRVHVIRAIAVLQTFPEVRTKADIKRALGVSQGVLYQYLDGLKAMGQKAALSTAEPTKAVIDRANSPWAEVAKAKKDSRGATGGANGAKTKADKRESGELNPEDNAPEVHTTLKPKGKEWDLPSVNAALDGAIAALTGYTAQHGFTAKESEKLAEKLAEMSALVESHTTAKAPAKAKAKK